MDAVSSRTERVIDIDCGGRPASAFTGKYACRLRPHFSPHLHGWDYSYLDRSVLIKEDLREGAIYEESCWIEAIPSIDFKGFLLNRLSEVPSSGITKICMNDIEFFFGHMIWISHISDTNYWEDVEKLILTHHDEKQHQPLHQTCVKIKNFLGTFAVHYTHPVPKETVTLGSNSAHSLVGKYVSTDPEQFARRLLTAKKEGRKASAFQNLELVIGVTMTGRVVVQIETSTITFRGLLKLDDHDRYIPVDVS